MFFDGRDDLQASVHHGRGVRVSEGAQFASAVVSGAPVGHRPDIDGLRAIAVLSVVFFHAGLPVFSGGFVGVDVFFVISGYLITSIVRGQLAQGGFRIGDFYDRRIRRIFPALFAVVAVTTAVACWWMMPFDLQGYGGNLAAMAGFASNFFFIKTGYFDGGADIMPLMHTWSLAVEEQFYILFPIVFALLARRGAAATRWGIVLLLAASLIVNVYGVRHSAKFAFYTPWHRAWELLAGSVLALGWAPLIARRWLREALAIAGTAAIAIAVFAYDGEIPFPGAAALLPVVGAALLIHTGAGGAPTWIGRALSTRSAVFIGLVSYSFYLWHWPIFVLARYRLMRELSPSEGLLLSALALLLAVLSWRFVERPFRHGAGQQRRHRVFAVAALCSAGAALVGGGLYVTRGIPGRLSAPVRAAAMAAFDENPDSETCHNHKAAQIDADDACLIGSGAEPTFAVLGDSFADALVPGIAAAARDVGRTGFVLTKGGCSPLLETGSPECQGISAAALGFLKRHPKIDTVLMSARWSGFAEGARFGENRAKLALTDARTVTPSVEDNRRVMAEGFDRSLAALAPRRVVVIAFSPEQEVRPPRVIALSRRYGTEGVTGVGRAVYDQRQRKAHAIIDPLAQRPNVSVIDLGPALCDEERCPGERGGIVLYSDDNHVSRSGAVAIKDTLARAFAP
jgi:peptidoglycan/LPS O-acetylase OafA/YrhL